MTTGRGRTAFLLCIEANRLEPQGLMLCESIRRFGGDYADAPIFAVSPRPSLAVGQRTRARLAEMKVDHVVEPLNQTGSPYGSVNRIVAGAWAERHVDADTLVVLDTDTVFLSAPDFSLASDVGVRPVDMKGATSAGPLDPLDSYWSRMCALGGIGLDDLPMIETSVDRRRVRASYNGGLAVLRPKLGVLGRTREIFFAALASGLRPQPESTARVHASTGDVGPVASQWWGSSQAALSIAIWATTSRVQELDERYNIPLHLLALPKFRWPPLAEGPPVLAHYHYLAEGPYRGPLDQVLGDIGCPDESRTWLRRRVSLFDEYPPERAAA